MNYIFYKIADKLTKSISLVIRNDNQTPKYVKGLVIAKIKR